MNRAGQITLRICSWVAVLAALGEPAAAQRYSITNLGAQGVDRVFPFGINNRGQVVGKIDFPPDYSSDAFVWQDGVLTDLGSFGGFTAIATAINDSGVIIGLAEDASGGRSAFISYGSGMIPFHVGASGYSTTVNDINNHGAIVGNVGSPTGAPPFLYSSAGLTILPIPAGAQSLGAYGLNNSDAVVGGAYIVGQYARFDLAALIDGGNATLLPNLQENYSSDALDINDAGLIAGTSHFFNGYQEVFQACTWENGLIKNIHSSRLGFPNSNANAINNRGDIVGYCVRGFYPSYYYGAFLYRKGVMRNLNAMLPPNSGWFLERAEDINDSGQIVGRGTYYGEPQGFLLTPVDTKLILMDYNGDTLRNLAVTAAQVSDDPPVFTETPLGKYTSDDSGVVTHLSVNLGDSVKIAVTVYTRPAVKNLAHFGGMYSISLDNAEISPHGYNMTFTEIDSTLPVIDVKLGHTTLAFNIVASVEWDADLTYLAGLESAFRNFSNFLWDVSDGQMRLDTVVILDDKAGWDQADFRIHASNMEWPRSDPNGIQYEGERVWMPRDFWGNDKEDRDSSAVENPLLPNSAVFYRTLCHEFAHYGLRLYDEYLFTQGTSRCAATWNYGVMDSQFPSNEPYASEFSSLARYSPGCYNTEQWTQHGSSCWTYLHNVFERRYTADSIFVPIIRPSERNLPQGTGDFAIGPNDDLTQLDYDVGALVTFPIVQAPSAATTALVYCHSGNPSGAAAKVEVILIRPLSLAYIVQGRTSSTGKLRVLGALPGDLIIASTGFVIQQAARGGRSGPRDTWLYGTVGLADSIDVPLAEVQGEHPFIAGGALGTTDANLTLATLLPLGGTPTLTHLPEGGTVVTDTLSPVAGGYGGTIAAPEPSGQLLLRALDDSGAQFFVPLAYTLSTHDTSLTVPEQFWGPEGGAGVVVDSGSQSPSRLMILSSPYPVIRTGLTVDQRQAGNAHALITDPLSSLSGPARLTLRYDDADLSGASPDAEASLRIFHWDDGAASWALTGGAVDTEHNEVIAPISAPGVYAAFTTDVAAGIHGGATDGLPYHFSVSQNYPNPFNPTTTIEYSLPSHSRVVVDIFNVLGQAVRTLVDEEKAAGTYTSIWDGRDDRGRAVGSGIYLFRITAGNFMQSKKMLLLK